MELKQLTNAFCQLVGGEDILQSVYDILLSDRKEDILSKYVELIGGDLQTDELQRIFQYYYADRKEKCQDFTPKSIAKLCAAETRTNNEHGIVYDMCAGSGALTIQKWVDNPDREFICEELDDKVIPLLLFNMAVRNMNGYVINRNVLSMEKAKIYRLQAGKRFSEITIADDVPEVEADEIVSNPPYNIKWEPPTPLTADSRFTGKPIPPASNANFAFVLTALDRMAQDGKCAFILPNGVLSSDTEKDVRRYIVENGLLERVITLPTDMFESTSISTCILVFSCGNETVKMYDCRDKCEQEQRDQNGQYGGASHEGRTYHKTFNVIPDSLIQTLTGECEDTAGLSREVAKDEIRECDYRLTSSLYIAHQTEEIKHRPFAEIMQAINFIEKEKSVIKLTVNETFAKQLGLDEIARLEDESQKNAEGLNKTFELLGGHFESRRFMTLTKSKTLKIENQDTDEWSSLLFVFLPMWKQHIFYLNQLQNQLLAEMRDALLPELMNGNIDVSDM